MLHGVLLTRLAVLLRRFPPSSATVPRRDHTPGLSLTSTSFPCGVKALLKCPLSYLIKNVPFFVFGFALCCRWPGPERSPAEPAGRSGGPGQRRSRRDGRQLRGPLLHLAPDSLSPRMLRWRYPLRLGPRRTRPGGPLRSLLENRLGRCGDLPPAQRAIAVLDHDAAVPSFAH